MPPVTPLSVVTPTLNRPDEVRALLECLSRQTCLPVEIILVDGASEDNRATEQVVQAAGLLPFVVRYVRASGGTAVQRNFGIEQASGEFIAFLDDDIYPEPEFFASILAVFAGDVDRQIGGIVGYRTNAHFTPAQAARWRWYRRLKLLTTFEPGRYDFQTGYPINANLQPPFEGTRPVDFMTTSCAVWRRQVLDGGLRFDPFFRDYGILEDAHFSLRARKQWALLQCGHARCEHRHSPRGRENRRKIGYKSVVNYYYVFHQIAGPLTGAQKFRFWRYQAFELLRVAASMIRRWRKDDGRELIGRIEGFLAVASRKAW